MLRWGTIDVIPSNIYFLQIATLMRIGIEETIPLQYKEETKIKAKGGDLLLSG